MNKWIKFSLLSLILLILVACGRTVETPSNAKPVAQDDSTTAVAGQSQEITLEATDADDDSLTYEVVSQTENGSLSEIDVDKIVYTANADFSGEDSFRFRAFDGTAYSNEAIVSIIVSIMLEEEPTTNQAPIINPQSFTVNENAVVDTVVGSVVASDPDGDSLSYAITGGSDVFSIDASTGEISTLQRLNFEVKASYSLQVSVSDGRGSSQTATITITVTDVDFGTIVFAGDSITFGWEGDTGNSAGRGWSRIVQDRLQADHAADFMGLNRGRNGDTAVGLRDRLVSQVIANQPSYVTIQIGTNDVYNNGGTATASPTVAAYETQIAALLQTLQQTSSIKEVFVLSIISPVKALSDIRFPGLISITQAQLDSQVASFNTVLQQQAQQRGFIFVDLAAEFPANATERGAWLPDGVHPSAAGYQRIASMMEAELRNYIK